MNTEMDVVTQLKALADPARLRILSLLAYAGDLCSCEIEAILDIKQSNASRHLRRLRESGLIISYKKAQWVHYRLEEKQWGEASIYHPLILAARSQNDLFQNDLDKLDDYKKRGFSCATIHQWRPFEFYKPEKETK